MQPAHIITIVNVIVCATCTCNGAHVYMDNAVGNQEFRRLGALCICGVSSNMYIDVWRIKV
jgi:hypothetical protein